MTLSGLRFLKGRSFFWGSVALCLAIGLLSSASPVSDIQAATITTLVFTPVADASVSAASPSTNSGPSAQLRVGGSPTENAYLRFTISGLTGPVFKAVLRVYTGTGSSAGYSARPVGDTTWNEKAITYASAPTWGGIIGSSGAVSANTWTSVDITPYVKSNGTFSLALTTTGTSVLALASRESGAHAPQLLVSIQAATGASPTSAPTRTLTLRPAPAISTLTPSRTQAPLPTRTPAAGSVPTLPTATPSRAPTTRSPFLGAVTVPITFTAVADAYVNSSSPSTNTGTSTQLRVDGSPVVNSYLRFTVSGLTGPISNATLRVLPTSNLSAGYSVRAVSDNTWGETTITFSNAPALGATLGSSGAAVANTWNSINVTAYITGNGTFSLALATSNSTALALASRESGANAPQLVITLATATSTPTSTATATATAILTSTPTSTSTATATSTATRTSTSTATASPTGTSAATASPSVTASATPTSTSTRTATATNTVPASPTATATLVPGTLCVLVYNDLSGDGARQPGEPLLTGAQITIQDPNSQTVGTWTTDGTEPHCFSNLPPGNFSVTEVNPSGYTSTTPDLVTVTVSSGSSIEIDFGDQQSTPTPTATASPTVTASATLTNTPTDTATPTASPTATQTLAATATPTNTATSTATSTPTTGVLCVLVYNDLSGDGTRQPGEPLLTGAQIVVTNSGNSTVGTWTTNGTEPFCFANLAPDTFSVIETNPPGYSSTTPDIVSVPVTGGSSIEVDFGDQQFTPTPTNTVTSTATASATLTSTATSTPTLTPTSTSTSTATSTPTLTPTRTPTALPTRPGDPVIVAAGDIACDPTNANFNGASTGSCQQRATANLITSISPSAVLILGDNQYYCGGLSAFQQSYDLSWGRFKSITHPSVGNHEYLTSGGTGCDATNAGAAGYFNYFGAAAGVQGKGYYSYDIGTWHLIALNSNCSDAGGCGTGSPQETWLRADLAAHSNLCTLAYWHIPVWSSGGRASPNMKVPTQDLYNANADLILDAHDHLYERFAPQDPNSNLDLARGIRSFVVGTGGANHTTFTTTIFPNSEARNDTTFGILKLTLHPGSFDWQFVPMAGGTFTDSGTQTCH